MSNVFKWLVAPLVLSNERLIALKLLTRGADSVPSMIGSLSGWNGWSNILICSSISASFWLMASMDALELFVAVELARSKLVIRVATLLTELSICTNLGWLEVSNAE